jgi:hypothetical protein
MSELIAYALFGVIAILTFLSISGSLIHIFRKLDRGPLLPPARKLALRVRIKR